MVALLSGLLHQLGLQIGRQPIAVFLANLFIFLPTLSYFLLFDAKIETDVRRGFAHQNGRAAKELKAFGEFYNVTMDGLEILLVFLEAKEPEKRLRITGKLLAEIDRLDRKIKGMSVKMDEENVEGGNGTKIVRLEQFQTSRGDVNFLFRAYKWAHQRQEAQLVEGAPLDSQIHLDHPISRIYGFQVPLNSHFFGVQFWEQNGTIQTLHPSKMESATIIALWYMFEGRGPRMRQALAHLELELFELAKTGQFSDLFNIHLYGDEIANFEMMRGSQQTICLLAIGIGAMVTFMLVAFRQYKWKSQLILITLALLSPSLAIMVTFALLGWFGIQFNAIMSIMPFLVLGIGVDNAFLLLHSWRKWSRLEEEKGRGTKENMMVPERMGAVIAEMGPSIAITSITNGLAFGIGVFSPSSLMSSFCLCTTVAIGLDFLFEFLVFAPCLPFIRWSHQKRREKAAFKMRQARVKFCRAYAAFIVSRWAKLVAAILLCITYTLAVLGIHRMEATFEPQKTFPADSPLQTSIRVINRVMTENSPVSLIISHPPDVGIPKELAKFQQMIGQLGSLPNALRIDIWLNDYLEYDRLNFNQTHRNSSLLEYSPSYGLVPRYLRERMMEDKRIVKYRQNKDGSISVEKFVFILYRWGELSWLKRAFFVDTLRSIVDQFPEFSVTVFDYDSTIYDLILTVKTELLKAVLVTLTCMALVCFFIIPNLRTSSIATFSVLSISFTLMGALGWWGLDMDPVTMINVLMAIGFSVDFSAHICYHFNKMMQQNLDGDKMGENVSQRQIESILNAVGRPMLEAAISTIICVFPLFFLSIYIIEAFARTVFCLGAIGLVHGLFIVPVLLSLQLLNGDKFERTKKIGRKCCQNEGGVKMMDDDNKSASMASSNQPLILPNGKEENENGTNKLLELKMNRKVDNEKMIISASIP